MSSTRTSSPASICRCVYTVEVRPTGAVTVAISGVFTLPSGVEASILAIGDGSACVPLKLEPILNDLTLPPVGKAKVLIGHYAPFNANPLLTAVDLCEDRVPTKGAGPIIFGINSGYLPLDAGIYDLSIAVANTNCAQTVYDLPPLQFNPGESYDVFAIGKNNAGVSDPGREPERAGLSRNGDDRDFAPFANTVAETAVDIRINGQLALTDVVYGAYAADIVMPSGALVDNPLSRWRCERHGGAQQHLPVQPDGELRPAGDWRRQRLAAGIGHHAGQRHGPRRPGRHAWSSGALCAAGRGDSG